MNPSLEAMDRKREYYRAGKLLVQFEASHWNEEDGDFDVTYRVEAWYRPERPTPACRNPSAPEFADPGDGAEWCIETVARKDGDRWLSVLREDWPRDDESWDEALEAALAKDWRDR